MNRIRQFFVFYPFPGVQATLDIVLSESIWACWFSDIFSREYDGNGNLIDEDAAHITGGGNDDTEEKDEDRSKNGM